MQVRLIAKTTGYIGTEYEGKNIEEIAVAIARLSSGRDVDTLFDEPYKLIRHCLLNGHWSVFGTTNLVFEIITSRAIGREYLRHYSLRPQEISQRYAQMTAFEEVELRKQCKNNRQSSTDVIDDLWYNNAVDEVLETVKNSYNGLLNVGVSRETARMILPECTQTKIIFNGTIREWITTLNQRLHNTAQKEARLIAEAIKDVFIKECPIISQALYNFEYAQEVHILDRMVLEKFKCFEKVKKDLGLN